jgi:hypothetical protein
MLPTDWYLAALCSLEVYPPSIHPCLLLYQAKDAISFVLSLANINGIQIREICEK